VSCQWQQRFTKVAAQYIILYIYGDMALLRTPLSYPGGKSNMVKILYSIIETRDFDTYIEPFLGGGSFALYVSQNKPDTKIIVNDIYKPLANFWTVLRDDAINLVEGLIEKRQKYQTETECRTLFAECHDTLEKKRPNRLQSAVAFYAINKMAFSSIMGQRTSFSRTNAKKKFSEFNIRKLLNYAPVIQNWEILCKDYQKICTNRDAKKTLIYLDPPYDISCNLYGKNGDLHRFFDHYEFIQFCEDLKSRSQILISYNESMAGEFEIWTKTVLGTRYCMRTEGTYLESQKSRNELILTNFDQF